MGKRIVLWGIGRHCINVMRQYLYPVDNIEMVIDSDDKIGKAFGKDVSRPSALKTCTSDLVVVGSKILFDEIKQQVHSICPLKSVVLIDEFLKDYPKADTMSTFYAYDLLKSNIDELIAKMQDIGELSVSAYENAKVYANRAEMLRAVPAGGQAAEIGVAYGGFSDLILKEIQPNHFYAIDYFNKDNPYLSFWGYNYFEESGMTHEQWYRNKYRELISSGKMTVCSGMSWDEMKKFEDDFFSYIYIDACHDYESVKKDIEVSYKKIKNGGFMQFNDYTLLSIGGTLGACYGIVPAVNEMIIETGSKVKGFAMQLLGYCDLLVKVNK